MKKDEGLLSGVILNFEELPLFKKRKKAPTTGKTSVLGNNMDTRHTDSGINYPVHRTPSLFRHGNKPLVRYIEINGKQVPIYSPRFFHH